MSVTVLQNNDGTDAPSRTVDTLGMTDQDYLNWKAARHTADGWTVQSRKSKVTATKAYTAAERAKDPNLAAKITRTFSVV